MTQTAGANPSDSATVKETVVSIIIAFVVAFVFRGFVLEPFLIPTGSMAPTLLGAHMRFHGNETGYTWTVGPWNLDANSVPLPVQRNIEVTDPMSGAPIKDDKKIRSGDRIFVMKSLYTFFEPERFDVIVFKNPTNPQENYIKRLVGLPNEELAFIDGDVFARPTQASGGDDPWEGSGWKIERKSERVQRAVWQPVFSSEYTPLSALRAGGISFKSPWLGGEGWDIAGKIVYRYSGSGPTELKWDSVSRPITDFSAYDEPPRFKSDLAPRFPDSDVRVSLALSPGVDSAGVAMVLSTRRHEFRAEIAGTKVDIRMRPAGKGDWATLGSSTLDAALPKGRFTELEFWHSDQSLRIFIAGREVCSGTYDWSAEERTRAVFGRSSREMITGPNGPAHMPFIDASKYQRPELRLEFTGGPLEVRRVALDRDLYYRACGRDDGQPGAGTDPRTVPRLGPDQFFVCGDNSEQSEDARRWLKVDPWVAEQIDPTLRVVHRDLLVGKAFFVYFPAPETDRRPWLPDLGRLRFIW